MPRVDGADGTGQAVGANGVNLGALGRANTYQTGADVAQYMNERTLKGGGILPARVFDPDTDAKKLYKAMRGLGECSCVGKTDVRELVLKLYICSPGTNERHLIQVLCNRSYDQRRQIAQVR